MRTSTPPKPVLLLILDGWGHALATRYNAITAAKTPHWDHLLQTYPHTLLEASGGAVGLPEGQMGNSEVGHLTMGAGRVLEQDLTRLNRAIATGDFFTNPIFLSALRKANPPAVHIIGLLSPGGVHSHQKHIDALLTLCSQMAIQNCYIHVILDGRDTPPTSAATSIQWLQMRCAQIGLGQIASLTGRYYAMDRDHRWERTQAAYQCIVAGQASYSAATPLSGLQAAYARGETDEFVQPTALHAPGQPPITIASGDIVFFMNFRSDRVRQLSRALTDPDFAHFTRAAYPRLGDFVSLTAYAADIPSRIAFPPLSKQNGLGACLSQAGFTQLRIAETEKYPHVTFFFNGGIEQPFLNETRLLIPSKKVATYDLVPEMAVSEITDQVVQAIQQQTYDVIICNFANPDMLGHTGNQLATEAGITVVDGCIGKIIAALKQQGGEAIITADHGNADCMYDTALQQPHTAHTLAPVPLLYVGRPACLAAGGSLADVAPTLLAVLGLRPAQEMTGKSLLSFR
ncbi:2,3-bisphosphoglycerate-independent phosphoglycerate mutase [Candidatus Cardinium sp. TP]|uniref:2,3-bisphosphoglycerate-independent phosphoglycerate mutase n=1 Tax=Candidatus Cardinium sp. TP TaxID=2961955 RepID=UPI0021AE7240|nr:2,3-bisphosphoglycerate-independent phosphoglycerate mutase [Candidatus Cardinium sp. TP]MCT4697179.1 2,3-bisphosphoglycerate-independent phosphoglycerate mutase [Candidatus Cardinium sp. TP]